MSARVCESASMAITRQDVVVVNVDFRNSPDAPFPGGLEDCLQAAIWVNNNRDLLEITSQIAVIGGSGGGNLALATTLLALQRGHT